MPSRSRSEVPEWDESQRLKEEKSALGLYLSGHPIDPYREELSHYVSGPLSEVLARADTPAPAAESRDSQPTLTVAGLVMGIRTKTNARGGRMAFLTLADHTASIEVRVFSQAYEEYKALLVDDSVLVVEGRLVYDDFSDSLRLNAERLMDIASARETYARRLKLSLCPSDFGNGLASRLEQLLEQHRSGSCRVVIDYSREDARAKLALGPTWTVSPSEALVDDLRDLVGRDRVSLEYGQRA